MRLDRLRVFFLVEQHDPDTGAPIKQAPGAIFRSLLAGALLGGAIGSESSKGGFAGGFARGGAAVEQQGYQRQQEAQDRAMKRQQLSLDEQRAQDEHMVHQATAAQIVAQTAAFHQQQQFHDQEAVDKKNKAAEVYKQTLLDAGGTNAPIAIDGKIPANGEYSGADITAAFGRNPSILTGPPGTVRHFVDVHDASDLDYVSGKGWVDASGNPVSMGRDTVVRAIDVPEKNYEKPIPRTGKEINTLAGYQLVPKDREDTTFNVPLEAAGGLSQKLKNDSETALANQRNRGKQGTPAKRGTPAQFAQAEAKRSAAVAKALTAYQKGDLDKDGYADAVAEANDSYQKQFNLLNGQPSSAAPTKSGGATPGAAPAVKPKAQQAPSAPPAGATMKVPGDDGKLHWSDGKTDLGVVQ